MVHLLPQYVDTLVVNDLKIGNESLRQFADGSHRDVDPSLTGEFRLDLLTLTAFHESCTSNLGDHVIGKVTAGGDDPTEFLGPCRRKVRVIGTISLLLDSQQSAVACRNHVSPAREPDPQRFATLPTTFRFPGKRQPRSQQGPFPPNRCYLLSLLIQQLADGYRALFLSRSYLSKMASNSSRDIDTPLR